MDNTPISSKEASDFLLGVNGPDTEVFLLGAGCSIKCGVPIMRDFMRKVRENAERDDHPFKDDYNETISLWRNYLRTSYVYDRWWDNIEELYTQAHLRQLTGYLGSDRICESLRRTIWDVVRRFPDGDTPYQQFAAGLFRRIEQMNSGGLRPVVITTNWDVNLEIGIWHQGMPGKFMYYYPGFEFTGNVQFMAGTRESLYQGKQGASPTAVEICKLHGSVNWIRSDGDNEASRKLAGQFSKGLACFECQTQGFVNSLDGKTATFDPVIVPPTLGKTAQDDIIAHQWARAIVAIGKAKYIWIIGYSFAETDTFMLRLLSEGIVRNDKLEGIIIVNPEMNSAWRDRVRSMFARSWWEIGVKRSSRTFEVFASSFRNPGSPGKLPLSVLGQNGANEW